MSIPFGKPAAVLICRVIQLPAFSRRTRGLALRFSIQLRTMAWCGTVFLTGAVFAATERPLIFPLPNTLQPLTQPFVLDDSVRILVPQSCPESDLFCARMLVAHLADRYGVSLRVQRVAQLPAEGRFIVMGDLTNPLIAAACATEGFRPDTVPEAYALRVSPNRVVVAGHDATGAFYGLQSLRQLVVRRDGAVLVPGVLVHDKPKMPFRAIRLYLPGHENIAFFKRFLRDFMALYKFNTVVLELNACMRLDRHPELNAGWIEFSKSLYYTQRYYPSGPHQTMQDSAHQDTADGEVLEKDEVADLVAYARRLHIGVIPEIPTFTHSYYLLTRHKELAAIPGAEWPDTYQPMNPAVYDLVFDVLDEYVDVIKPSIVHIGHDEMFFPIELVQGANGKSMQELFAYDVRKLHDHLASKGIRTALYGDELMEAVRGSGTTKAQSASGWQYSRPGALSAQQARELIPSDVLVLNWCWQDARADKGRGEANEVNLSEWGFQQAYMNFTPYIDRWAGRSGRAGVIGGSPSSWSATNEYTFGKDLMVAFLGTENLMWSEHWPEVTELNWMVQQMLPDVRRNLSGRNLPSQDGNPVAPVDLAASVSQEDFGVDLSGLRRGTLGVRGITFSIPPRLAVMVSTTAAHDTKKLRDSNPIPIGADVSSIIFLHASARGAANDMSYRYIHNYPDTADLLGWYEVVYDDGFIATVPVRYGVNILPLDWAAKPDLVAKSNSREYSYAYEAECVDCGSVSLFAYEWVNPRYGKTVKEVRLHGTTGFRDAKGKLTPENTIILAGMAIVKKRPVESTD